MAKFSKPSLTRRVLALLLVVVATCPQRVQAVPQSTGRDAAPSSTKAAEIRIYGAGSTTIYPVLSAWIDEYNRLHPEAELSYQAVGSGGGLRLLLDRKVSFAATDGRMTDEQLSRASGRILHFPATVDAVVPIYNLAQVPRLRLSGSTLADIFLGKITRWDDPSIASDNPGVNLPRMDIKVAHFNDGRVDTFYMASYLSKESPAFKATLANSLPWPVRNASAGYIKGEGLTGFIAETPGSIGYFSWDLVRQSSLTYAAIKNSEGEFVAASSESLTAAGATAAILAQAPDFRILITNAPGKTSYPIAYFIWLLVYEDSTEKKQHEVMADFLKWALTDGQKLAVRLGFPPLPSDLVKIELQRLRVDYSPTSSR